MPEESLNELFARFSESGPKLDRTKRLLESQDPHDVSLGVRHLGEFAERHPDVAQFIFPMLLMYLGHASSDVQETAEWTFHELGPWGFKELLNTLKQGPEKYSSLERRLIRAVGHFHYEKETEHLWNSALHQLGPKLHHHDPETRGATVLTMVDLKAASPSLIEQLLTMCNSTNAGERRAALDALKDISEKDSKVAIRARPVFLRALGDVDKHTRDTIAWALAHQGNQVLGAILERLNDPEPMVRQHVWETLSKFEPSEVSVAVARTIGTGCCESLNDPKPEVRMAAAVAASRWIPVDMESDIRPNSFFRVMNKIAGFLSLRSRNDMEAITNLAIQRLTDMCLAPHAKERTRALHALQWIRKGREVPHDDLVCSAVFKNLEHEDEDVRSHACDLVPLLSLGPPRMVSTLVPLVDDPSCKVASSASKALLDLAKKGTDVSAAAPALCRLLSRRECDHWGAIYLPFEQCCEILLLLPREIAKSAVPLLEASLSSESGQVVRSAAKALAKIDQQVDKAFPRLAALLESGELHPESFCDALYTIGPAAAPFTDELVRLLGEPDWDTQWAAADALGSIASTDPACIAALIKALSHPSGIVRSAAVRALAQLGKASVPYLIRVLQEGNDEEREWAADALGVIGADAADAVDALRLAVRNSNPDVRDWSAIALAKITKSAEFVPHLMKILGLREGPNLHALR